MQSEQNMIQSLQHHVSNIVEAVLWYLLAANKTVSLGFINDVNADRSSEM